LIALELGSSPLRLNDANPPLVAQGIRTPSRAVVGPGFSGHVHSGASILGADGSRFAPEIPRIESICGE